MLVGQNGLVDRIPVDLGLLAIDQALFHHVEEEVLLLLVIFHVAGGEFTGPVQRKAHGLQLLLHRFDVLVGPGFRMGLVIPCGVFRRHAERVPAHRVQNVETAGALVTSNHVAHRVVAHMAHVDTAGRIGEHL
ncbi:hypothetical protein D3C71_453340 [compost metagenome]